MIEFSWWWWCPFYHSSHWIYSASPTFQRTSSYIKAFVRFCRRNKPHSHPFRTAVIFDSPYVPSSGQKFNSLRVLSFSIPSSFAYPLINMRNFSDSMLRYVDVNVSLPYSTGLLTDKINFVICI